MLERYNPVLRIVCIALVGLILYQVSKLAFKRDAIAVSRLETPLIQLKSTNSALPAASATAKTNSVSASTNAAPSTNSLTTNTNTAASTNSPSDKTNVAKTANRRSSPSGPRPPRGPGGAPGPALPADFQALVDKIKQSQLFGPEIKPPPMALLGIAGRDVFLRGPNGQTGLIREGEELGGAKLIRIGTNRVIIEHEGREQELMIFEGFGSETLLQKKDKP